MGCSQNYGNLLVMGYITVPKVKGCQNGSQISRTPLCTYMSALPGMCNLLAEIMLRLYEQTTFHIMHVTCSLQVVCVRIYHIYISMIYIYIYIYIL